MGIGDVNPLADAEETVIAAALQCTAEEVRATGLEARDFLIPSAGQMWHAILRMPNPSSVSLALTAPRLNVDAQRWIGKWDVYAHPAGLRAHAALVKAESRKRQAMQGHVNEINRIRQGSGWWTAYERTD